MLNIKGFGLTGCSVKLPKSFLAVNVSDSHASDSGRGSSDDGKEVDKAGADNGMS